MNSEPGFYQSQSGRGLVSNSGLAGGKIGREMAAMTRALHKC